MATAASAIANGGNLVQPRVVKAVVSPQGVRTEVTPHVIRRAVEPGTADQLTSMMEGVVERGTATSAKIAGFTIAGKTGTSHKLENGHYAPSDYNASFVGFLPSRKPAVTILVVIDSPHGSHGYFGGSVAAPAFQRIAETTMRYLGVGPNLAASPVVFAQQRAVPREDAVAAQPARITIVRTATTDGANASVMPDLLGLNAREAIRVLARVGLAPRVTGDGIVVQQEPRPGSPVDRGSVCALALGRPVATAIGSDQRQ
jgi:membrane peptidoglycan carboxypeptidase